MPIHLFPPAMALLAAIIATSSCTKVIDVDLNAAERKYVIEGVVTDKPGDCRVIITETKDFDGNNHFPGISGATVTIADNIGNITTLSEIREGIYEAPSLTATTGITYTLHVTLNGQEFTAQSIMQPPVRFDSLFITRDLLFGETWSLANVVFNDAPGISNHYLFVQRVNGKKTKDIYAFSDALLNGNHQEVKLYVSPDTEDEEKLKSGDSVQVEMQCIDASVYKYWYSAGQSATGSGNSATPSNPVTNIQGAALGYFSAHTTQVRTIVAP